LILDDFRHFAFRAGLNQVQKHGAFTTSTERQSKDDCQEEREAIDPEEPRGLTVEFADSGFVEFDERMISFHGPDQNEWMDCGSDIYQ
jgi:hypothetical protein